MVLPCLPLPEIAPAVEPLAKRSAAKPHHDRLPRCVARCGARADDDDHGTQAPRTLARRITECRAAGGTVCVACLVPPHGGSRRAHLRGFAPPHGGRSCASLATMSTFLRCRRSACRIANPGEPDASGDTGRLPDTGRHPDPVSIATELVNGCVHVEAWRAHFAPPTPTWRCVAFLTRSARGCAPCEPLA